MADAVIKLVDDAANTGKMVDADSLTVGSNTAHRQRVVIADPATAAAVAKVTQPANADHVDLAALYAQLVGAVGLLQNVAGRHDRARGHLGDFAPSSGAQGAANLLAQRQLGVTATSSPTAGAARTITMASTTGFKVAGLALVADGSNSEFALITAVVANTSITVANLVNAYTTPTVTPVLLNTQADVAPVGAAGIAAVAPLCPGTPMVSSSTGAAAALNQTFGAVAGRTNYLTGFTITGLGATAAGSIQITTTGLITGQLTYTLAIPAGATLAVPTLDVRFPHPIPASAANTAIVLNVPSFGTGNTVASVSMYGFRI